MKRRQCGQRWSVPWYLRLQWSFWTLFLLLLSAIHITLAQTEANVSSEYGEFDKEFPYFIAGTAYPCSELEECTYVINGSDPIGGGGVDVNKEETDLTPSKPCVLQGHLKISQNWYGYLAKVTLAPNAGLLYYRFSFPKKRCCIKLLLYLEEQTSMLRAHMNCLQRQSVVDPLSPQVITLSPSNAPAGCTNVTEAADLSTIECQSGRWLKSDIPRKWSIAVSSCGSPDGLNFEYSLVIYGHMDPCPGEGDEGGLVGETSPGVHCSLLLTIPSSVMSGLVYLCAVFYTTRPTIS